MPKQNNFAYLLAGLLFLLLGIPLFRDLTEVTYLVVSDLAFSIAIFIGIWSLQDTRRWFLIALVLMVLGVGGNLLALAGAGHLFIYVSLGSYIVFLLLAITLATRQVFRAEKVSGNNIIGAICIYLLLGVIWSLLYVLVNLLIPGSFGGQITGSTYQQLQDFLYYSVVTLTSLGYGDILPVGATARALSALEVIFGQFYIAILVAALVANYLSRRERV